MSDIVIRPAEDHELATIAELRWQWVVYENETTPAVGYAEFVRDFVRWARDHASTHHCLVIHRDEVIVGMAWLAIVKRVPTPTAVERASGDMQCVYVLPGERDHGLGGRIIDAVLELAGELGLERVVVHSSSRAIPAYSRHGFDVSPRLLQASCQASR